MPSDAKREETLALSTLYVGAPAPAPALAAAVEEAKKVLVAYNSFDRDHSTILADMGIDALRSILAALAADDRLEKPTLDELAIEADNFARTAFPARSAESISEHLRREAVELAETPNDPEEMADVFILLGNLVHFTGTDLNAAVVAKLAKNRARKWGKPDAHGVVEHVREAVRCRCGCPATGGNPCPCDCHRISRPAPPAAVREAAERLRSALCAVPSWQALLPESCGVCEGGPDCSGDHEPCGCHETLLVVESALDLLAALSAPAPEDDGRVPVTVSRRADDKETMSFDGTTFTTVRPCRDCGVLICGGPTRCLYCAEKEAPHV